jgi:hypothetical protein
VDNLFTAIGAEADELRLRIPLFRLEEPVPPLVAVLEDAVPEAVEDDEEDPKIPFLPTPSAEVMEETTLLANDFIFYFYLTFFFFSIHFLLRKKESWELYSQSLFI